MLGCVDVAVHGVLVNAHYLLIWCIVPLGRRSLDTSLLPGAARPLNGSWVDLFEFLVDVVQLFISVAVLFLSLLQLFRVFFARILATDSALGKTFVSRGLLGHHA